MNITYDYYRVFYYVAKWGSFSKAAEALFKGQPNITKTVSNLENQLGCKLFVRKSRGVTLTPEGERLYRHVEIAFKNLDMAEQEIASAKSLNSGIVTVAATEIALYGALIFALSSFAEKYPGVKLRLSNLNSPDAIDAVKNGVCDFAAVTLHDKTVDGCTVTEIMPFKEGLYCKKGFAYNKDNIFQSPYISLNQSTDSYRFYSGYLKSLGINKEPDIEVATADQILPLVKSGIGIGFTARFMAQDALNKGEVEEIILPKAPKERYICIVQRQNSDMSLAAKALKSILLSEII